MILHPPIMHRRRTGSEQGALPSADRPAPERYAHVFPGPGTNLQDKSGSAALFYIANKATAPLPLRECSVVPRFIFHVCSLSMASGLGGEIGVSTSLQTSLPHIICCCRCSCSAKRPVSLDAMSLRGAKWLGQRVGLLPSIQSKAAANTHPERGPVNREPVATPQSPTHPGVSGNRDSRFGRSTRQEKSKQSPVALSPAK
ncbi:hypothetical protein BD289DRAFT_20977 [Coniella lustricola]|uniref:Uncharacterized protein n=1 Tax=Coniella lustricola TaxID=2025994 RepID=A0A2T3A3L1_9PEZI|nr:hypothetical protein BD289DRAFT_20977 [Coniella lustricola]